MTRILFDAHQLGRRQTGNETYVRELLRELRTNPELGLVAAVEPGQAPLGVLSPPVALQRVPRSGVGRLAALALASHRRHVDVLHSIYFLPWFAGCPTVVTIHDVSFERHPEFFSRATLARDRILIRDAARRASRIVTVSETSRQDLIELWGIDPQRVVAIPNGVSQAFTPRRQRVEPVGPEAPLRVLAVGSLQPRKNIPRLLKALARVDRALPVALCVVGPDGYQAARIRALMAGGLRIEIRGYVTESELADEYRRADVFVYPSLYEGFGLPVLEAMASGVPVIASRAGALPEVAGDAALLVDPVDVDSIAEAVMAVASDAGIRESLRAKGIVRASQFSWARAAASHARVYEEVCG